MELYQDKNKQQKEIKINNILLIQIDGQVFIASGDGTDFIWSGVGYQAILLSHQLLKANSLEDYTWQAASEFNFKK